VKRKKKKKKKRLKKQETRRSDDINMQEPDEIPVVEITTESMANVYISQGLYDEAMKVYEALLFKSQGSRLILQKIDDLKLLIMLSKGKSKITRPAS